MTVINITPLWPYDEFWDNLYVCVCVCMYIFFVTLSTKCAMCNDSLVKTKSISTSVHILLYTWAIWCSASFLFSNLEYLVNEMESSQKRNNIYFAAKPGIVESPSVALEEGWVGWLHRHIHWRRSLTSVSCQSSASPLSRSRAEPLSALPSRRRSAHDPPTPGGPHGLRIID